MSANIPRQIYRNMVFSGYIESGGIRKTGRFHCDDGRCLVVKQIQRGVSLGGVAMDNVMAFAFVVDTCGRQSVDPEVVVGVNHRLKEVYPISYLHELLNHKVVAVGDQVEQSDVNWLNNYWLELFAEIAGLNLTPVVKEKMVG